MSAWQDLRDVLEMYTRGGLVIMTGLDGGVMETAVSSPSSYDGKIYSHNGIRTTIQFDSNYVTVMSPTVLQQPEVWQQHVGQVNKKLAVINNLKALAQKSWMVFLLIPAIWFGVDLANTNSVEEAWSLIAPTLLSTAMVWGRKWLLLLLQKTVLPLITKTVGWFVQRKFKQFVEGT